MEGSLAHLALTNYPDQIEYIDKIMETTGDIISQYLEKKNFKSLPASAAAAREVINLIKPGFQMFKFLYALMPRNTNCMLFMGIIENHNFSSKVLYTHLFFKLIID